MSSGPEPSVTFPSAGALIDAYTDAECVVYRCAEDGSVTLLSVETLRVSPDGD